MQKRPRPPQKAFLKKEESLKMPTPLSPGDPIAMMPSPPSPPKPNNYLGVVFARFHPTSAPIKDNAMPDLPIGLSQLVHVYQLRYQGDNLHPTGWGDFLRGTYFLLEWGAQHHLQIKIQISHPIKYYLKQSFDVSVMPPPIRFLKKDQVSEKEWREYLIHSPGNFSKYVYTIQYPVQKNPSNAHKQWMRNWLEPTQEISEKTERILESLQLMKKNYRVLHLRFGDDARLSRDKLTKFIANIGNILSSVSSPINWLLLADSLPIKHCCIANFPQLKAWCVDITHLGEGKIQQDGTDMKIFHTMIDFQLLRFAKQIDCLSCYSHGSGFSEWCAKTYDVPYSVHLLNPH